MASAERELKMGLKLGVWGFAPSGVPWLGGQGSEAPLKLNVFL